MKNFIYFLSVSFIGCLLIGCSSNDSLEIERSHELEIAVQELESCGFQIMPDSCNYPVKYNLDIDEAIMFAKAFKENHDNQDGITTSDSRSMTRVPIKIERMGVSYLYSIQYEGLIVHFRSDGIIQNSGILDSNAIRVDGTYWSLPNKNASYQFQLSVSHVSGYNELYITVVEHVVVSVDGLQLHQSVKVIDLMMMLDFSSNTAIIYKKEF